MDVVSGVGAQISSLGTFLVGYIIPFLFVLTLVVFFHELGHFWVARRAGVRVLTFSLGFGPEIAGFTDRKGTRWRLAAIPLGGFVRFYGDEDAHGDLCEVARRAGFLTRGQGDMTVLETTMPVDEASFSPVSAMMQTWAAAFQLDYDGWECAVVTN